MGDISYQIITALGVLAFTGFWVWFLFSIFRFFIERYERKPIEHALPKENRQTNRMENPLKTMRDWVIIVAVLCIVFFIISLFPKSTPQEARYIINSKGEYELIGNPECVGAVMGQCY